MEERKDPLISNLERKLKSLQNGGKGNLDVISEVLVLIGTITIHNYKKSSPSIEYCNEHSQQINNEISAFKKEIKAIIQESKKPIISTSGILAFTPLALASLGFLAKLLDFI